MPRPLVLTCLQYDTASNVCVSEAWVEQPGSFIDYLPTVEEAHTVGGAMAITLITIAAMGLLLPSRSSNSDD